MTRPTGFYVVGQPFAITYVAAAPTGFSLDGAASTDLSKGEVQIVEGQGPFQERDSVLHELLHAALGVMGQERNEDIVKTLTPVLLDALRSNKALTTYLLEDV